MDFKDHFPEYASVEKQIRAARVTGAVVAGNAIAGFIADCWNALRQPAARAPILIDRRRESRTNVARAPTCVAHR